MSFLDAAAASRRKQPIYTGADSEEEEWEAELLDKLHASIDMKKMNAQNGQKWSLPGANVLTYGVLGEGP